MVELGTIGGALYYRLYRRADEEGIVVGCARQVCGPLARWDDEAGQIMLFTFAGRRCAAKLDFLLVCK